MASGDVKYQVKERGYNELRGKLRDHNELFGPPHRTAMTQIGQAAGMSVRAGAPIGSTGRTVTNVRVVVSRAQIPSRVRVVEAARSDHGFAYPKVLEFSPYSQSRYRKGTNRHRFWMRRAIDRIRPVIDASFKAAMDGVERIWLS